MKFFKSLVLILLILALSLSVSAQEDSDIPIGLQKIQEYNQQYTLDFSVKVSFFIAFMAGILGILSPCILPFLPAYFSYTFKEKKNITKMTFIFFLGFSLVFVAMGVLAGFIGATSLLMVQKDWFITIAGVFLVFFGFLSLTGRGFSSFIHTSKKFSNDVPGTFLFGLFFALGWTACLGPILAGILGIGALLGNIFYSAVLLFFYSLGNLVPIFLLAMLYDKYDLSQSKFIKGKMFSFNIDDKKYNIHSTNLIAGLLFILIGGFLLIFKGTGPINTWDVFGTKQYFYSFQNALIAWPYANVLGVIVFLLFAILIGRFFWKKRKNVVKNE